MVGLTEWRELTARGPSKLAKLRLRATKQGQGAKSMGRDKKAMAELESGCNHTIKKDWASRRMAIATHRKRKNGERRIRLNC